MVCQWAPAVVHAHAQITPISTHHRLQRRAQMAAPNGGVALAFWMSPLTGGMGLLAARRAMRALRWSAHRVLLNAAGTAARIGRPGSGRDGDRGPDHHRDGGGEGKPIA